MAIIVRGWHVCQRAGENRRADTRRGTPEFPEAVASLIVGDDSVTWGRLHRQLVYAWGEGLSDQPNVCQAVGVSMPCPCASSDAR